MSTSTLATPTVAGRPLTAAIRTAVIALAIVLLAVLAFSVGRATVSTHRAPAVPPVHIVSPSPAHIVVPAAGPVDSVPCRMARPC